MKTMLLVSLSTTRSVCLPAKTGNEYDLFRDELWRKERVRENYQPASTALAECSLQLRLEKSFAAAV